jgi:type IV pilus assembly protein PilQ
MKKYLSGILSTAIIIFWMLICNTAVIAADQDAAGNGKAKAPFTQVGYLENVILEKLPGKERIALVVSLQPLISVGTPTDNSLVVKLEDMYAPENLRRVFGGSELNNISYVMPVQQSVEGKQWIYLTIDLKEAVPYAIKQEGKNIYIDFNISLLPQKKIVSSKKKADMKAGAEAAQTNGYATEEEITPVKKETAKRYTDRLISLDFQDADIKSVLRLMAEYGNISIVSGDDVKGNVTMTMKNVPWDQALNTILDVNGLAKKQMGDVISVMTLERKKKDEGDKVKAEEDQRKAEDQTKARELKLLAEMGKLRQISIEAKIVEATEDFIRNIGVKWGFGNQQSINGTYGLGVVGGSNPLQGNPFSAPYPPQIGATNSLGSSLAMAAVNFPQALASPTIGLVFGGASGFLEAQLAALESTTSGKIISAPKVVTMDNVKATIKQGDEVPYVTPASGTSPATITFKEAVLKLEVKPKITEEGKISMEIKATNDTADYARGLQLQGNPPIRKNEVESTVVIPNGSTVVIGGIIKTQEDKSVSGLPWLQKIPVLGWLFKTENFERQKTQLFIFVTPKIITGDIPIEQVPSKAAEETLKS